MDATEFLLTGIVMVVLAILGIIVTLWYQRHHPIRYVRIERARSVGAVILGIRAGPGTTDAGPVYFAQVSYTTRGFTPKQITTEIRLLTIDAAPRIAPGYPPTQVGDRIPVEYDQDAPALAQLDFAAIPKAVRRR